MDKYAISLMNLGGTSILLCAGLSRFVFPLISLEGRKFWILGLTPVSRDQILRGKFAFAATGSLLIAESLILISDVLLGLPSEGLALHAAGGGDHRAGPERAQCRARARTCRTFARPTRRRSWSALAAR